MGAILGVGPDRETPEEGRGEGPALHDDEPEPGRVETNAPGDRVKLNDATFEELRELGFSVTQATRVITYRERQKGFTSVDDLAEVPGMPDDFLAEVRPKLAL